jgi:hypothetical protein
MNFRALFTRRNPARELALIGVQKRKATVFEVAQQMRRETGLPPHPALDPQR